MVFCDLVVEFGLEVVILLPRSIEYSVPVLFILMSVPLGLHDLVCLLADCDGIVPPGLTLLSALSLRRSPKLGKFGIKGS